MKLMFQMEKALLNNLSMKYFYILLFLTTQLLSGQETIAKFDLKLKNFSTEGEAFPIVDNERVLLFFNQGKDIQAVLLDENQNLISKTNFLLPKRKFKTIIGYNTNGDDYHLYFSTKKRNEFCVVIVNLKNNTSSIKNIDLKLESTFLDTYLREGILHVISLSEESIINIHSFDEKLSFTKNSFEFSSHQFNVDGFSSTKHKLADFFLSPYGFGLSEKLEIIDNTVPNALEKTSSYNKIYHVNDEVIITIDAYGGITKLIRLDIKTFESSIETIKHIDVSENEGEVMKSNSLIFDNKLYQLSSTKKNLSFSFQDLESNTRSKIIKLNIDDEILFKNSPIIQDGGYYSNRRELAKTKQYLRKIFDANPGISINKHNNLHQITLGASKELMHSSNVGLSLSASNTGGGTVSGFSPARGVSYGHFMVPTMRSYGYYTSTKSTYINCLFENDLNHIKDGIHENVFDNIRRYENDVNYGLNFKTIFRYNNVFLLGYYSKGKYILKEFNP